MTDAFRSILVPLDGAEVAEQALAVGASLAARAGATLHLASALEPVPIAVAAEFGYYGVEPDSESRMRLTGYLAELADSTRREMGLAVEVAVVEGDAVDTLAEYVEGHRIDLVVMTTHARTGLDRFWLGSVADRLLRRVSVPVLLLHPSDRPQPTRFRRILIALDGQIEAPVLDAATTLCSLDPEAEYTLFRMAVPPIPLLTALASAPSDVAQPHLERAAENRAREYLRQVEERLRARGLRVSSRVVRSRDVSRQVVELAGDTASDCIAVGTHGAGGIERLLVGSVADQVVRRTDLPVLVSPLGHH